MYVKKVKKEMKKKYFDGMRKKKVDWEREYI
jgi:hypothetical protein